MRTERARGVLVSIGATFEGVYTCLFVLQHITGFYTAGFDGDILTLAPPLIWGMLLQVFQLF